MNVTGPILKNLRLKKNITMDQLAAELNEMFNINITGSMISKWETGKATPVYDHLKRLASYYSVTTDFLLGFDHYGNLTNTDLDTSKNKLRFSKKHSKIAAINKLLENDKITSKDLSLLETFIEIFISRKDKNLYR